jgi:putative SOS response-associated peptidase YedK
MCALYTLRTTEKQIRDALGSYDGMFPEVVDTRFTVHQFAPVIVAAGVSFTTRDMNFSLIPSWSKERKVKFATHNARLLSEDGKAWIFDKATWKKPFASKHCVIPISQFVEPIYLGQYAGNMVRFGGADPLFAAGIFDEWINKETGEVIESFSILTDDPVPFIKHAGHDRTPVFINAKAAVTWLTLKDTPAEMVQFLRTNRLEPKEWLVEIDRPMRPGWEKRIPG